MDSITRKCTKCGIEKPIIDFNRDNSKKKIPYRASCKSCERKNYLLYYTIEENKKKEKTRLRKYALENKERVLALKRLWSSKNKDKIIGYAKSRADKIAKSNKGITQKEWTDLCNKYDNKCLCCGTKENITLDHVFPISLGGADSIINAQPLCGSCNSKKGVKYIDYRIK